MADKGIKIIISVKNELSLLLEKILNELGINKDSIDYNFIEKTIIMYLSPYLCDEKNLLISQFRANDFIYRIFFKKCTADQDKNINKYIIDFIISVQQNFNNNVGNVNAIVYKKYFKGLLHLILY